MLDEGGRTEPGAETRMPEKIKALFDVAVQAGFAAAKREPGGSYRFMATKGENEIWLTINPDGSKVDRLEVVDLKTRGLVSHEEGETVEKWADFLSAAGINAKEGENDVRGIPTLRIEPIRTEFYMEKSKQKGIGMNFQEKSRGKFYPTNLRLAVIT